MENDLKVSTLDEIQAYFLINQIGGIIWRMNHDMADGRIPEEEHPKIDEELARISKTQIQAISSLHRFGVTQPFRDANQQPSGAYVAWFKWWDSYVKGLSEGVWRVLEARVNHQLDVSEYRPEGDWHDNIAQEEENIKKAEEFWKEINSKSEEKIQEELKTIPQRKILWN
jgi:hypothetical protein